MMRDDSEQRLTDIDHTLDLMDFDGSNDLDINEFFEVRAYTVPIEAAFYAFSSTNMQMLRAVRSDVQCM